MNRPTAPHKLVQAATPTGTTEGYMPGFGNDFETEALPGALPQGMNSPQKCNYGLYGEQLSGTAFTANRAATLSKPPITSASEESRGSTLCAPRQKRAK